MLEKQGLYDLKSENSENQRLIQSKEELYLSKLYEMEGQMLLNEEKIKE